MNKLILTASIAGLLTTCTAVAQERIELNNIYPLNQEIFQLSDRIYFTQDNQDRKSVV